MGRTLTALLRELHAFWDGLLGPTSAPPQDAIDASIAKATSISRC
jgi:hypothetical protein